MPRILLQQGTNLVNKFALLLHKCRFAQDSRDKPENDGSWRCWLSICCSLFNHPSPDTTVSTDKPSKEGLLYFSICLTRGRYNKRGADNTTSIGKPNACIRCRCVGRPLGQTIKFVLLALFAWCSTLYAGAKRTAHYCFYCLLRGIKVLPLVATGGEVLNNITFKGLDVVRQYAALFERQKTHTTETAESGVDKVVSSCEKNPSVLKTYTNFLRQRKTALDAPLYAVSSGRSMIEMLGVLAIIGVLSVAGIAGYSKAMTKWKTNKTIEQTTLFISNLMTSFANQKDFYIAQADSPDEMFCHQPSDIELLRTLGIIDDEMLVNGELKTPFGGEFCFGNYFGDIYIYLNNLPREACMTLATTTWGNGKYDIAINNSENSAHIAGDYCHYVREGDRIDEYGVTGCYSDGEVPLTPDEAAYGCSCKDANCGIEIYFFKMYPNLYHP